MKKEIREKLKTNIESPKQSIKETTQIFTMDRLRQLGMGLQGQIDGKIGSPSGSVSGDILYHSSTGWTRLAKGSDSEILTLASGLPSWAAAAGGGDVTGPASATDNAIARFNLTTGKIIQNSVVTIADTNGNMAGVGTLGCGAITTTGNLDVGDNNITNVGEIDLDLIRADAADGSVTIELDDAVGADLLVGNNNALVVEGDNDRVGIGTVTPNAPLEVKGAKPGGNVGGFQSGMFHVTGDGDTEFSNSVITGHSAYNTNTQLWYLGSMSSGNDGIGLLNRQDGDIQFYTNNAFKMIIEAAGDVGIGVTDPDTKLEVFNAGNQLKLSFDATDNTIFAVDTAGDLTITPSGGNVIIAGDIGVTGTRVTKGWFTDLESTNDITIGGTALAAIYAAIAQTMYIGTTQVAINRASAALTLAGITLTTPNIGTPSAGVLTNCTALPAAQVAAGTFAGALEAADHGTAATDQLVNVAYGTGAAPAANTTTIGSLYITHAA